tara:strand:- start:1339 stop:3144 length:1806 start_codon:yes stop_codon:yes gene_type:complete
MVKLLRLTTENDLKFEANLDAGIPIKENSQIAIQNLTFESTDFTALNVDNSNRWISFSLDRAVNFPAFTFLSEGLLNKSYKKTNISDLYKDLEATLNSCLEVSSLTGNAFGNFKVLYPNNPDYQFGQVEKVTIIFKLSPVIMTFHYNDTGDYRGSVENELMNLALEPTVQLPVFTISDDESDEGTNLGNTTLRSGIIETNEYKYFAYSRYPWCKGSGAWMVRIGDLVDNGGAQNTNGFSVGIAVTSEDYLDEIIDNAGDIIPDSLKSFEVRVSRPSDFYDLIIDGVSTPTTAQPFSFTTADGMENDHILFEKNGTGFSIKILQSSIPGGVTVPLYSELLTRDKMGKNMFPYFCIFGRDTHATVGHPVFTLDPIINPFKLDALEQTNDNMTITGLTQGILGGDNAFDNMSLFFDDVIPELDDDLFSEDNFLKRYNPVLKINGSILRTLGFDESSYPNNIIYNIQSPTTQMRIDDLNPEGQIVQFNLIADGLSVLVNSDNYIVVLDSNPLYSYDASKFDYSNQITVPNSSKAKRGRRYNILATIPINDNNGFVEFNANELVYIDLDNKFPQVIKNIRLRVLNKNFDEIETNGESVMTLLIKDN